MRERARVWLRAPGLDAELAQGVDPRSSRELLVRAERLVRPGHTRMLAAGLRRVVTDAERPSRAGASVPLDHRAVRDARHTLLRLADHLDGDPPLRVEQAGAVARIQRLMTSPESPVYADGPVLAEARDALIAFERA